MNRVGRAAYWVTPSLFCLAVYWLGLRAWFQQDDFAWLGLHLSIYNGRDLLRALFEPYAQGTFRFLSERAFFLVFEAIFGINALPFRIFVFLTQFANLVLLSSLTWRLTGSRAAGFWAPVLWAANSSLAVAMSWTSSYNEILFAFFLLLSFTFLLRYFETGKRSYYIAQWVTFLLGFGALELNVVYPALAALYTLCCARKYLRKTLPMFAVSIAYTVLHSLVAPPQTTGPYGLHFDWRIFATLWTYWKWALGPSRLPLFSFHYRYLSWAGTALLTLGVLGFALWKIRRKEWLAVFFLGWFGIVILPLVPLRDHISDYYLTVPAVGLAMLGAWAVGKPRATAGFALALLLAGVYLASSVPVAQLITRWRYERGQDAKKVVLGVVAAHQIHPGQIILLKGVNDELFRAAVYDRPFRLFGITEVYLVPGSEPGRADYTLPRGPVLRALGHKEAVVYDVRGGRLRNVTGDYSSEPAGNESEAKVRRVEVANPVFAAQLGQGWYGPEGGYRWMSKSARVRLDAPGTPGQKLHVIGYAPAVLVAKGPIKLTATINGVVLPPATFAKPNSFFDLSFDLPAQLTGKGEVQVLLQVDRTVTPAGETRQLGAAVSSVEWGQ